MLRHYANSSGHYIGGWKDAAPFADAILVPGTPHRPEATWSGREWIDPPLRAPPTVGASTVPGVSREIVEAIALLTAELQALRASDAQHRERIGRLEATNADLHALSAHMAKG